MGCGASSKSLDQTRCEGSLAGAAGNQTDLNDQNMFRKAHKPTNGAAKTPNEGGSSQKKTMEQKIQNSLTLPEEDTKEALSLAAKHPDLQDDFGHLVNIMHDVVKRDPNVFVDQLCNVMSFDETTGTAVFKDLMDFFGLIGGAKVTAEIYAAQLKSMNISHITDRLMTDAEVEEEHGAAVYMIKVIRMFWDKATDCSLEFAGRLAETSVLPYLAEDVKNFGGNSLADSPMFEASLTLLHNCARNKQKKQHFRDIDAIRLLTPFLDREDKGIKLLSLLTLSYIIDEEDNHLLFADASDFDFLLEAVAFAWEEEDHRDTDGYSLEELLQGMGNLAQNDDNKKLLMKKDVLVLLKPVLESGSDVEKQEAAQILWNLAFDKENRSKMEEDKELMDRLEKLKNSSNRGVAKACGGALWVLNMDKKVHRECNGKQGTDPGYLVTPPAPPLPSSARSSQSAAAPPPPPPGQAPPPTTSIPLPLTPADPGRKGHVMISYQWSNQKMLLQIKNSLHNQGFRVWMDVDNISGSTLQAMAEAVEQAEAVLMCMSQRYKDSPNCRTEAEYAFALQKPIIPLLMERSYTPDGWLGILRGSKLFFDFSGKYPYEKKLEDLMKELRRRGLGDSSEVDGPVMAEKAPLVASTPVTSAPVANVSTWSQKDVLNWLNKHHLGGCHKLQTLSGENIKFLQKLSCRAPEFFFNYLKQDLALTTLNDLMHFSDAIDSLP